MPSAICFNLDQSKILSSGNGLNCTVVFDYSFSYIFFFSKLSNKLCVVRSMYHQKCMYMWIVRRWDYLSWIAVIPQENQR